MNNNEKNYEDLTIKDEIVKKIRSIDKVRTARIISSGRLKKLSSRWNTLFFFLNFFAIILVISSLVVDANKTFVMLTSCYTLYVILLQYYISVKNYDERSLRFHYHQLELENNILELKNLVYVMNKKDINDLYDENRLINDYNLIMAKYQLNLSNIENHISSDFKKDLSFKDQLTLDNVFIILNILMLIVSFVFYLYTLFS